MKKEFHGYYKPTKSELEKLWKEAIFSFDANVLLNLYTYSPATSKEVLDLIGKYETRIWLPYQVAKEYHKNRIGIIQKEAKRYQEISSSLDKIERAFQAKSCHPYLSEELTLRFGGLKTEIQSAMSISEKQQIDLIFNDPIRDRITELFEGRVGAAMSSQDLDKIYQDGSLRFASGIPPGYSDSKKPEPERYGDLVLWSQLMENTSQEKKPLIFVTDDQKEDWWLIADGNRVGPRPELQHEFRSVTTFDVYIYSTDSFLKYAKELGEKVSKDALAELSILAEDRKKVGDVRKASEEFLDNIRAYEGIFDHVDTLKKSAQHEMLKYQQSLARPISHQEWLEHILENEKPRNKLLEYEKSRAKILEYEELHRQLHEQEKSHEHLLEYEKLQRQLREQEKSHKHLVEYEKLQRQLRDAEKFGE